MANKIDEFISKLKHPLKAEMEEAIKIIRGAGKDLEEDVKWGGPSFGYKEPMATINPRITDYVVFIFHKGELIKDKSGLLEPAPQRQGLPETSLNERNKGQQSEYSEHC